MFDKVSAKIILVVDDNLDLLHMMKNLLELAGYAVLVADNIAKAMAIASTVKISAALLDLSMPGCDDFELLKMIKKILPDLPVIMVTGYQQEASMQRAIDLGAWDYVTKPVDFDYLKKILKVCLPECTNNVC